MGSLMYVRRLSLIRRVGGRYHHLHIPQKTCPSHAESRRVHSGSLGKFVVGCDRRLASPRYHGARDGIGFADKSTCRIDGQLFPIRPFHDLHWVRYVHALRQRGEPLRGSTAFTDGPLHQVPRHAPGVPVRMVDRGHPGCKPKEDFSGQVIYVIRKQQLFIPDARSNVPSRIAPDRSEEVVFHAAIGPGMVENVTHTGRMNTLCTGRDALLRRYLARTMSARRTPGMVH